MKKTMMVILCFLLMLGCSPIQEKTNIEDAKQILSNGQFSYIIYFNTKSSDIVYQQYRNNDKKDDYYFRNNDKDYFDVTEQNDLPFKHADVDMESKESVEISHEFILLLELLNSGLIFDTVNKSSEIETYYYSIPSQKLNKYNLTDDYKICIIIDSTGRIINIRLFSRKAGFGFRYIYYFNVTVA